jgi:hypothetical protein
MGLSKETYVSLQNYVIPLDLDFMPPYQISNMSLNDLRRQVATHDKTLIEPWMDELSIALDSRNLISTMGTPLL